MTGTDNDSNRDPLETLVEEFVERHRRGERPSIDEYAARHPELAERIETLRGLVREVKSKSEEMPEKK